MIAGLALPVLALIALAVAVPHALLRLMPESGWGLVLNAALSGAVLTGLAAAYFAWAYARSSPAVLDLFGARPGAAADYLLGLGLKAGLVWGPVLVLAVSYLPRRWRGREW